MALREEEWLHLAKQQSVGMKRRVMHGRETRCNMDVGNAVDRYWAYCQACKEGGIVRKEHVLYVAKEPDNSRDLSIPHDMTPIDACPTHTQQALAGFLAVKHMDFVYLPPVFFSDSRKRLLVEWNGGYMGRDTSNKSPQKWLTYNRQHYLGPAKHEPLYANAVLVEDTFSFFKVRWALAKGGIAANVYCTLGTRMHDQVLLCCIQNHDRVVSFYDGDLPGITGQQENNKRLRGLGIGISPNATAPWGLDPKDMDIGAIAAHVTAVLAT